MATPTLPTVTSVMNRVSTALNREHDENPRSHKSRALWKLHVILYPAFVLEYEAEQRAAISTPTPQPSEPEGLSKAPAHITRELHEDPPGTTPEELATIVAEETERADFPWSREAETAERELGEAARDQWDQGD